MINHNVTQRFADNYLAITKQANKLLGHKTSSSILTMEKSFLQTANDDEFQKLTQIAVDKLKNLSEKLDNMNKSRDRNERKALKNNVSGCLGDMKTFLQ